MTDTSQELSTIDKGAEEARAGEKGARRPGDFSLKVLKFDDVADHEVKPLFGESVRVVSKKVIDSVADVQAEVDAAREKAEQIVVAATEEAEKIRAQAREDGRAAGHGEWLEELEGLRRERERAIREAESDLLVLATRLAGRIVGRAIEADPSVAAELVAESLQHVRGDEQIVVHVSPPDLAAVQAVQRQLVEVVGGSNIYFEDDEALSPGDCVIVTRSQRIDARLDTQLEQMRRMLEGSP